MMPSLALSKPLVRTALLIGNSIYPDAPLLTPADDIGKMSNALTKSQFEITEKANLKKEEMRNAVLQFGQSLKDFGGIGIFYYAGYAVQVR